MNIIGIPALNTNYIWLIYNYKNDCVIIDPGETVNVLNILKRYQLVLQAILLTHHHADHINGVRTLIDYFPKTVVYGPYETKNNNNNHHHILVSEGEDFILLQKKFRVLDLPGHTLGHIGFYNKPWLFCGDTVFSAGCGKIFAGLEQDMYKSFIKILYLPHDTLIFSGHEYTLSNINFAASILPQDQFISNYRDKIILLRKNNKPTVPTTIKLELKINPFFRCNNLDIKKSLNLSSNFTETWKIFTKLREKKDHCKI